MKLIVQKFGGSSLGKQQLRSQAANHVLKAKEQGYAVVVVVSAIGRSGDPYATDTLLSLIEANSKSNNRSTDLLMACGEIISSVVFARTLEKKGCSAVPLTGWQAGIITTGDFGEAEILNVKTEKINSLLKNGHTVVVAGFQGYSSDEEITTLGRGGSDTTAAALGAALNAERVEIFTDVASLMTADPRLVPKARPLLNINYQEIFQLAQEGAKVIHPRAVDIAMQYNIPLMIRSTIGNKQGTLINNCEERTINESHRRKLVTGVAHLTELTQIKVETAKEQEELIFAYLAAAGISIDLINVFPDVKIFTIMEDQLQTAESILKELKTNYKILRNCAKVSIVGTGIRGVPGVMARVVKALNKSNVEILQTADSHLTISCLVRGKDVSAAVQALHTEFNLDEEQ